MPEISIKNVFFLKLLNRKLPPPSVSQTRAWPGLGISEEMRCQRLLWRAAKVGVEKLQHLLLDKLTNTFLLIYCQSLQCLTVCCSVREERREEERDNCYQPSWHITALTE